jgi:hypothetical protein
MDTEDRDDLNARVETKLGEELRNQLDRQVGRAAPYFLKRCAADRDGPPIHRRHARLLTGLIAVAATLCAALIVWQQIRPPQHPEGPLPDAVVALPPAATGERPVAARKANELQPNVGAGDGGEQDGEGDARQTAPASFDRESPIGGGRPGLPEALLLGRALKARTRFEGTLLVGHTTVRKVRRQWLERVEWFDPQHGARIQRIVPREETLFVPLPVN